MLKAACYCGTVTVKVPRKPKSLTSGDRSTCRRCGVMWVCHADSEMQFGAADGATDGCAPCAAPPADA